MLKQPSTRAILWLFTLSRLLLVLMTYIAFILLTEPVNYSNNPVNVLALLSSWHRWDAINYTRIAQYGYQTPADYAFFPLFPWLIAAFSFFLGSWSYVLVGTLISNLALLGTLFIVHRLATQVASETIAQRTLLYLCIFPTAFFFFAAYNESLYIFLSASTFLALARRQWWLAGGLGLLASLTRSVGVLLVLPYLYELWKLRHTFYTQRKTLLIALSGLCLIPLGTLIYAAYNWFTIGNPLAFIEAQENWSRYRAWPWQGLWQAFSALFWYRPFPFGSANQAHTLLDLGATVGFILLIIIGWRKLPRIYSLWMIACLFFILISPATKPDVLLSNQRFVLELFPAFITLALLGEKHPRFHYTLLLIFATLQAILGIAFLMNRWVV